MFLGLQFFLFIGLLSGTKATVKRLSPVEKTKEFWYNDGKSELLKSLSKLENKNVAKNIVLFLGDGMGISTITAARIYKNQRMVKSTLPDIGLAFEKLSTSGLIKTHSVNAYVPDSSATMTAIMTGVKTNSRYVGIGPRVENSNCSQYDPNADNLLNVAELFYRNNKSVGIVTTTRITHATPACVYAHSLHRNWEYRVPKGCKVDDIAQQLIKNSHKYNVILGGGLKYFHPKPKGKRRDKRDLIAEWKKKMAKFNSVFVKNETEFKNVNANETDYLFGLFNSNHLSYDLYRKNEPSLADMTETAINILSKNKNGYFLMVEGGKIDHAHHNSRPVLSILETLSFEKAVETAIKKIDFNDTLLIVTADHSHVFTIGSYAYRDEDITKKNKALSGLELDQKGHTTLLYSNGPGYKQLRENVTHKTEFTPSRVYSSGVPLAKETHGGEDVAVFSEGPWSHLLGGMHHQSYIGHAMMFSSCVNRYSQESHCDN